ncbi:hypothetical protein D3C81_1357270 [compost metagenome]
MSGRPSGHALHDPSSAIKCDPPSSLQLIECWLDARSQTHAVVPQMWQFTTISRSHQPVALYNLKDTANISARFPKATRMA